MYDLDLQLTQILRPDEKTVDLDNDNVSGQLQTVAIPRGDYRFTYAPGTGQIASINTPDGDALSFTYDGSLLLSTEWTGLVSGTVERSYNYDFRVLSRSVNGDYTIGFRYDADGLLTQAGDLILARDPDNGLITGSSLEVLRMYIINTLRYW